MSLIQNLGYGYALQTGYHVAIKEGFSLVVQMDGDGQHAPESIPDLLEPLLKDECDLVIGSRALSKVFYPMPCVRRWGQKVFAALLFVMCGLRILDPTSGFQAFCARALRFFTTDDFPGDYPDTNVLLYLHLNGMRIREVPSPLSGQYARDIHARRGAQADVLHLHDAVLHAVDVPTPPPHWQARRPPMNIADVAHYLPPFRQKITLLVLVVIAVYWLVRTVRLHRLREEHALLWFLGLGAAVVVVWCDPLLLRLTALLGVSVPASALLLLALFFHVPDAGLADHRGVVAEASDCKADHRGLHSPSAGGQTTVAQFVTVEELGEKFVPWRSAQGPPAGWLAVSVAILKVAQGRWDPALGHSAEDAYEWLRGRERWPKLAIPSLCSICAMADSQRCVAGRRV